jgi:hypothetical protein
MKGGGRTSHITPFLRWSGKPTQRLVPSRHLTIFKVTKSSKTFGCSWVFTTRFVFIVGGRLILWLVGVVSSKGVMEGTRRLVLMEKVVFDVSES